MEPIPSSPLNFIQPASEPHVRVQPIHCPTAGKNIADAVIIRSRQRAIIIAGTSTEDFQADYVSQGVCVLLLVLPALALCQEWLRTTRESGNRRVIP